MNRKHLSLEMKTRFILTAIFLSALELICFWPRKQIGCGESAPKAQIENFYSALDSFKLDCGRYPKTDEGLSALVRNPGIAGWRGPYIRGDIPADPWGNTYEYQTRAPGFRVQCFGTDGKPGTADDTSIDSWPEKGDI